MFDKINEINSLFSVAGYESKLTGYILAEAEKYCDECFCDNIGNVICHKKGEGEKILVNAPVSFNGIFITAITDEGYGKFHTIGDIKAENLSGTKCRNEDGNTVGIILAPSDKEELSTDDMYIDFGVYSKEAAEKITKVGDVLEPFEAMTKLGENIYASKLSNSVPVYIALELLKEEKLKGDVYFAFTVMDNLGFKGAKTAATLINPDRCYTLSVADTINKSTKLKQGGGVAIRIKDSFIIVNKKLRDDVIKRLSDEKIPYQPEIVSGGGLSNNEIMYLSGGILTLNLNCPLKTSKGIIECVNEKDIENTLKSIKLIIA